MAVYKDKSNKPHRWRFRFTYGGKRYSGSAPDGLNTMVAAEREESTLLEQLQTGVKQAPRLRAYGERYKQHQKPRTKPLTYRTTTGRVDAIVAAFGDVTIDRIDRAAIDAAVTKWSAALKASTVNLRLATLGHMLNLAVEWQELARAPSIKKLEEDDATPRWLTEDEARRLLEAADDLWRPMMFIALRTGLRIGELRGLRWSDIDPRRGVLVVRRTNPGRVGMKETSPKSRKHRTVPLSPDALAQLAALERHCSLVFPSPPNNRGSNYRVWSEKGCYDAIVRTAARAELEDVGWHTLRHTFASWLVMRGFSLSEVQTWLGHHSVRQTEVYAHLAPGFGHDRIAALDAPLLAPAPVAKQLPTGQEPD